MTDVLPAAGRTEDDLLSLAYALEMQSEHPLARAVVSEAEKRHLQPEKVHDFKALSGNGLTASIGTSIVHGGSGSYIGSIAVIPGDLQKKADALAEQGKTPLFFEQDGRLAGIIAVADVIKPDSAQAIRELQKMGIETVMLTGDNERTARAIGRQAGVNRIIAGVLPDGKEAVIRDLQKRGKVAMVGDGINDAPALTRADIGIAIGAGTDVAIDSADVVLMNSKLTDVSGAVRLSRATIRNIHENLFWAFAYNALLIPMAAGLYPGIHLNPMWGAAAMALSSFTVCMNALRTVTTAVNAVNGNPAACPVPVRTEAKTKVAASDASMAEASPDDRQTAGRTETETVLVGGMMCENCERHVMNALKSVDGIVSVKADHKTGKAIVTYTSKPDETAMKQAIEDADYEYEGVQA